MAAYPVKLPIHLIILIFITLSLQNALAQEEADPQQIVEQAAKSVTAFAEGQGMEDFLNNLKNARAILIVPRSVKAGFIVSVSGGYGAMMARNSSGGWNGPAFYNAGGGGVGLQAGAKVSELILLVMNDQALEKMLETSLKFGAGVSVAVGVGAGVGADVKADVLAFSRSAGAFGGVSLEGGGVEPLPAVNASYYGQELSAKDILIDAKAGADKAGELRSALNAAAGG